MSSNSSASEQRLSSSPSGGRNQQQIFAPAADQMNIDMADEQSQQQQRMSAAEGQKFTAAQTSQLQELDMLMNK